MKKFVILLTILFCFISRSESAIITHPESKNMTVNVNSIFFTGGINDGEKLYINDLEIIPNEICAFSQFFKLKDGENKFLIKIIDKECNLHTDEYIIYKQIPKLKNNINNNNKIINPQYYITTKNNVILRKTPINAGMNRMGYLPENTLLYITDEKYEYSKVHLTNNISGWVLTKDIEKSDDLNNYKQQKIISETKSVEYGCEVNRIELSDNVPYSVIEENDKITLTIYNLDNNDESEIRYYHKNKLTRYSVTENNKTIEVNIKHPPLTDKKQIKKQMKIIIDAGHGGRENGAIGCLGDKEKDINLQIAKDLKILLESKKYKVSMTRNCDEYLSLQERTDYAKSEDCTLFISIHLNSVPINLNPQEHSGCTLYYYNEQCKELAEHISNTLSKILNVKNNGVKQASFAVIRPTEYIGVLAEVVFMVNPDDTIIYKSDDFSKNSAKGIYQGIEEYLDNITQ